MSGPAGQRQQAPESVPALCPDCGEPKDVIGKSVRGGDVYRCGCTLPPSSGVSVEMGDE